MMRGRGPCPGVRPSAYQFHPDFLLYSGSMLNIAHYRIIPAIARAMPEHVREGFRSIMASRGPPGSLTRDPGRERKADATAQWMHENGVPMGFRAPRASERARAFGMGRYLADLGLTEGAVRRDREHVRQGRSTRSGGVPHQEVGQRWARADEEYVPPPPPRRGASTRHCAGRPRRQARGPGSHRCQQTCQTSWVRWRDGTSVRTPGTGTPPRCRRGQRTFTGAGEVHMVGTELPRRSPVRGRGLGRPAALDQTSDTTSPGPWAYRQCEAATPRSRGRPRQGRAGQLYCVMDSLAQVFDGAPRACIDPGAERRAEETTGEVRRLCRIEGAGIVPTVAAWIWAVAERYAPGDPRPILIELGTAGGGVGGAGDHSTQVIVLASDGPWDGTVCAVASDGSHTVPLLWRGPDGSMAPNLRTGRNLLPGVSCCCWVIQELNAFARFAVDHLLRPFSGDSRGEERVGDGSWAGAVRIAHYSAGSDGQWPTDCTPSGGFDVPAGGRVAQWVGEAILRGVREWREAASRHSGTGAGREGARRVTVGIVWMGNRYPLQADDVNRLRLGGAWMASESSQTLTSSLSETPSLTCGPE